MPIHKHIYDNGLTLLIEPIGGVASAGMTLLLPAGAVYEPADRLGAGAVLSEMIFRGAGQLDARRHSDALDRLGVHRSAEVQTWHLRIGAAFMGDRLDDALPLLLDMARRPQLTDQAFGPSVELALQGLEGLEDSPQDKVMLELKRHHLGDPLGRNVMGEADHIRDMAVDDVRAYHSRRFIPDRAILALAGRIDFDHARDRVGELLGDWRGEAQPPTRIEHPPRAAHHIDADTQQEHIGLAHDTVGARDEANMRQRIAIAVLSGGMSGRLFTEVREKRGLCYAVYATYAARRDAGTVYAYAGTTHQRAAETRRVLADELRRIAEGVRRDEFERAVVGLKARLVMQGESTSARAMAIAVDQFLIDRPRTLDELAAEIDAVTLDDLNEFLRTHSPEEFTTLTIGPVAAVSP